MHHMTAEVPHGLRFPPSVAASGRFVFAHRRTFLISEKAKKKERGLAGHSAGRCLWTWNDDNDDDDDDDVHEIPPRRLWFHV